MSIVFLYCGKASYQLGRGVGMVGGSDTIQYRYLGALVLEGRFLET